VTEAPIEALIIMETLYTGPYPHRFPEAAASAAAAPLTVLWAQVK